MDYIARLIEKQHFAWQFFELQRKTTVRSFNRISKEGMTNRSILFIIRNDLFNKLN
jgi:hypothetical protein